MTTRWFGGKKAAPILAGVGLVVLVLVMVLRPDLPHEDVQSEPRAARYLVARPQPVIPRITGHGLVRPAVRLNAVAEVAGRVTWLHPELREGATLAEDTVVVRIDDTDYRLAHARAQSSVAGARANLDELKANEKSLRHSLTLLREKLSVARREFDRIERLLEQGSVSQSRADAERQKLLQLRQEEASLEQQLAVIPGKREALRAQLAGAEASAAQQQRNIERTEVRMPFTGRIRKVDAELDQYAPAGSTLFMADGVARVEVEAQYSLERMRPFIQAVAPSMPSGDSPGAEAMARMVREAGLSAVVNLPVTPTQAWQAEVQTISEGLDPASHTLGVLVTVDRPYEQAIPGTRPPLLDGMSVSVELRGRETEQIVLPRHVLHGDVLYLADAEDRLKKQQVEPLLRMGELVLLAGDALPEGSRVVTTDLVPAIEGMPLALQEDQALAREVRRLALPETD